MLTMKKTSYTFSKLLYIYAVFYYVFNLI